MHRNREWTPVWLVLASLALMPGIARAQQDLESVLDGYDSILFDTFADEVSSRSALPRDSSMGQEGFLVDYMQDSARGGQQSMIVRGQGDDDGGDPSDPTQVTFHLTQEFEWIKLSENQGDQVAYKVAPFIPLRVFDRSFLVNVEVPLTYARRTQSRSLQ